MAGKTKGVYKRNRIWWIRYSIDGRERCESSRSDRKGDAEKLLAERLHDKLIRRHPALKEDTRMNFASFVRDEYQKRHVDGLRSWRFYEGILNRLLDHFGNFKLHQITKGQIESYRVDRQKANAWGREGRTVSASTINREVAVLRHALNMAVEWGLLRESPIVGRIKMERESKKERYFSDEEIAAMLANAPEPLRSFILIAVNTGMRLREIQGLQWREVDLKRKLITLTAMRTKSQRIHHVPMNDVLAALFEDLKLKAAGSEFVFRNPETKKPFNWISHTWGRLMKKCQFDPPGRFHDLRHTWATRAMAAGVPPVDVQHVLGHANLTTTSRYSHATDKGTRRAVDLVRFAIPAGQVEEMPKAADGKKS